MSFAAPAFLLGLLLLPLLLLAYLRQERSRRAAAAAFASVPLQPAVAPNRPRWRRHAPILLYALALIGLLLALARPQTTVAVPVERATIVLAIDLSGSMQATDVSPNRLEAARAAASEFVDEVPDQIRVGLVAFNQTPRTVRTPTTDRESLRAAIGALQPSGGTATGDALAASLRAIERQDAPGAIVLLSDGASTRGREPVEVAEGAAAQNVPIYTVALGTEQGTIEVTQSDGRTETRRVPPDPETMREVAEISGGTFNETADADRLREVYEELGSRIASRDEEREITTAFAGGALALLGLGAALSLHWFRRIV